MLLADVTPLPCLFIHQTILNNCHVIASGIVKKGIPPFLGSKCDFSLRQLPSGSAYKISAFGVPVVGDRTGSRMGVFFGGVRCPLSETEFQFASRLWRGDPSFFIL